MSYSLRSKCLRFLSVFFAIVLVTATFSSSLETDASVASVRAKQEKIAAELEKLENTISSYETQTHYYEVKSNNLQQEIADYDKEIEKVNNNIAELNNLINELNEEEKALEAEIIDMDKRLVFLLREYQKTSRISMIQIFLTSGNFSESFSAANTYSSLGERINDLIIEIEAKRAEVLLTKTRNENALKELETSELKLEFEQASKQKLLEDTQGEQAKFEEILAEQQQLREEQEREAEEAQREFEAAQRAEKEAAQRRAQQQQQQNSSSPSASIPSGNGSVRYFFEESRPLNVPAGYFGKPTNGFLTRGFLFNHDALDIGAGSGTALYSIADGTVVDKNFSGRGYGHYVVLRHNLPSGQRIYTLYAHMINSSPLGVGAFVGKGQVVGSMGSTGNSTGPHLHFMMMSDTYERGGIGCRLNRYGGTKCYDPIRYVSV